MRHETLTKNSAPQEDDLTTSSFSLKDLLNPFSGRLITMGSTFNFRASRSGRRPRRRGF